MLATDDTDVHEAYRRFGDTLGIAFQVADDVKGTFWSSEASGKPEAGDVRKRKKTLPVVWALKHAEPADRDRLIEIYAHGVSATDGRVPSSGDRPMTENEVADVLAILERSAARETHAEAETRRYRALALAEVEALPCLPEGRRDLAKLVRAVIAT